MNAQQSPEDSPDLYTIAYEAHQQAARVQAIVHELATAAGDDGNLRLCYEAVELLLDPVCEHLATLDFELARMAAGTSGAMPSGDGPSAHPPAAQHA
jgi:hypothetical protein